MCDCHQSEILKSYEKTKYLAQQFANQMGEIVILYKTENGNFDFINAETEAAKLITSIEYIFPV